MVSPLLFISYLSLTTSFDGDRRKKSNSVFIRLKPKTKSYQKLQRCIELFINAGFSKSQTYFLFPQLPMKRKHKAMKIFMILNSSLFKFENFYVLKTRQFENCATEKLIELVLIYCFLFTNGHRYLRRRC